MNTIKKVDYKKIVRSDNFPIFLYNTIGERKLIDIERNTDKSYNRLIKRFKAYFNTFISLKSDI